MRIIIGLVVFIALWGLFLVGYRVTPPVIIPPPRTSAPCVTPRTDPDATAPAVPGTSAGPTASARPVPDTTCPATTTVTVTAVPTRDTP
ncbi:hypothetical protein [Amycolatopsis japonica]|uniref:hypothetical protein n=1 Tax=Amycolatopsis japonica TaxID=208439 RepID=UPI0034035185